MAARFQRAGERKNSANRHVENVPPHLLEQTLTSSNPIFLHYLLVEVHSEARFLRHRNVPVHYRKPLLGQRLPQGTLLDAILEVVGIRQSSEEVERGGDVDAGFIGMIDAQTMALARSPSRCAWTAPGRRRGSRPPGPRRCRPYPSGHEILPRSQISSPAAIRIGARVLKPGVALEIVGVQAAPPARRD